MIFLSGTGLHFVVLMLGFYFLQGLVRNNELPVKNSNTMKARQMIQFSKFNRFQNA